MDCVGVLLYLMKERPPNLLPNAAADAVSRWGSLGRAGTLWEMKLKIWEHRWPRRIVPR